MVSRLRILVVLVLALSAAFAACAQGATIVDCGAKESCSNVCIDLMTDKENCGQCGTTCAGAQVCAGGKCAQQCPNNGLLCSSACVNAKFDNTNCGACGKTCKPGEVCSQGGCGSTCQGVSMCGPEGGGQAYCADTKNDNKNCGKCGTQCMPGESCVDGMCTGACTMTQTLCTPEAGAPYCANLDSDNDNCGDCGNKCGTLAACNGGVCVPGCAPFQTMCKPDGGKPYCVNTQSDNANCGTCGNVCPQNKPICTGGQCSDLSCNKKALVLGDGNGNSNSAYQSILQGAGFATTVVASGAANYANNPAASSFGVIIVSPGTTYGQDMPGAGQTAITSAQNGGQTGVIFTEWAAYNVGANIYQTLKNILLFTRSSGFETPQTYTLTQNGHPIWNGMPNNFTTSVSVGGNIGNTLINSGVQIATCSQCSSIGVAVRDASGARIVQLAHAAGYNNYQWYNDANLSKMMANASLWAARCN